MLSSWGQHQTLHKSTSPSCCLLFLKVFLPEHQITIVFTSFWILHSLWQPYFMNTALRDHQQNLDNHVCLIFSVVGHDLVFCHVNVWRLFGHKNYKDVGLGYQKNQWFSFIYGTRLPINAKEKSSRLNWAHSRKETSLWHWQKSNFRWRYACRMLKKWQLVGLYVMTSKDLVIERLSFFACCFKCVTWNKHKVLICKDAQ